MEKTKPTIASRLAWLEFRDDFVTRQTELVCHYCGKKLVSDVPDETKRPRDRMFRRKRVPKGRMATVDHVMPLSRGGSRYDVTNLVIACERCNGTKGSLTPEEWEEKKRKPKCLESTPDPSTL